MLTPTIDEGVIWLCATCEGATDHKMALVVQPAAPDADPIRFCNWPCLAEFASSRARVAAQRELADVLAVIETRISARIDAMETKVAIAFAEMAWPD